MNYYIIYFNLALEKGFSTFLNAMRAYRKRNKGDEDAPILG